MRNARPFAATLVLAALLSTFTLLSGCGTTNYYKIKDPDTGRTYYKKGWLAESPLSKSNKEIELVSKEEYERAVEATKR